MRKPDPAHVRDLLDRLSRVMSSDDWSTALNPAQHDALAYLARANRFSRSPSHVADYLCTTRGTASQTLKALEKKGLIESGKTDGDQRSITYQVTRAGTDMLARSGGFDAVIDRLGGVQGAALEAALGGLLNALLEERSFKSFGLCRTCKYHRSQRGERYCRLLDVSLNEEEAGQICHEHAAA